MYEEHNSTTEKLDIESQFNALEEISPRINFIRKVFLILSAQLTLTVVICAIAMMSKSFQLFLISEAGLALVLICVTYTLIAGIALVCYQSLARTVPTNYILLFSWTIAEAYLVAFICAFSEPKLVLMAAFMTAGIVISLTIYAFTTKSDFTMYGGFLFIGLMAMLLFGIFTLFTNNSVVHIIYSTFGVVLFGFYLIYDTQLIVGGHKYEIDMDDYIIGALMLYIDIIEIFLHLLKLLQMANRS